MNQTGRTRHAQFPLPAEIFPRENDPAEHTGQRVREKLPSVSDDDTVVMTRRPPELDRSKAPPLPPRPAGTPATKNASSIPTPSTVQVSPDDSLVSPVITKIRALAAEIASRPSLAEAGLETGSVEDVMASLKESGTRKRPARRPESTPRPHIFTPAFSMRPAKPPSLWEQNKALVIGFVLGTTLFASVMGWPTSRDAVTREVTKLAQTLHR